jgi:lycopene cyclase domain-containing protein
MEYISILLLIFLVTLILEKTNHIHLYHNRKERIEILFIFFVIGIIWDNFALWRGDWIYPQEKILGFKIGLMPIEDYLYILIIPYCVLTIYKLFDSKFKTKE